MAYINTIGRRKTSVARIYLAEGSGNVTINGRGYDHYLNNEVLKMKMRKPFTLIGSAIDKFDIKVNVDGGGVNGQTDAICLGISRALIELNPENRSVLKKEGLLTRDAREVERKKYGKKKARKSFQFSKR